MLASALFDKHTAGLIGVIVLVAGIAAAAFVAARRKETVGDLERALEAAESAAASWKTERDAAVARAERLEGDVETLKSHLREAEAKISRLEGLTDLTRYFEQQREFFDAVIANQSEQTNAVKSLGTSVETLAVSLKPLVASS